MKQIEPLERPAYADEFDIGSGPVEVDAGIMETGHVPVSDYISQERFEQEQALFRETWLNIAREDEVPDPGDFIVREIACLSASILICRDREGKLRAFHNICRHRGMKLVWSDKGNGTSFSCPYHAWRFASDGSLKTVPDEECFPHLDKEASNLIPLALDSWEGFIFINFDEPPKQSLRDFLYPLPSRIENAGFDSYPYTVMLREELKANWKLVMEGQSENYHIRALHSRTVSRMISSADNPFGHTLNWEALGAHGTYSTPANPGFALMPEKPIQSFAFTNAAYLTMSGDGKETEGDFRTHTGFNPSRSDLWGADQITVFPNFLLNVSPNGWWIHRFWPLSPNRTAWEATYAFRRPASPRQAFALEYFLSFNRDTLMEDMVAMASQQAVMEAGAMPFIQFGEQETACRHSAAVTTAALNRL